MNMTIEHVLTKTNHHCMYGGPYQTDNRQLLSVTNDSILVCTKDIKNNFKAKTKCFIPETIVRSATMPLDFEKTSIKTW